MKCLLEECENEAKAKFCSTRCGAVHQHRVSPYVPKTRSCDNSECSVEFDLVPGKYKNKYCSRKCFGLARRYKARTDRICIRCGNNAKGVYSKYCSPDCGSKHRKEVNIQRWLDGLWLPDSEYNVPPSIREFLLEQANHSCPRCGWSETNPKTGKVPLTIDHIDGNARNNTPKNLRVLCPNCHSLTETYGGLNRGNGRSYRYAK